MKRIQINPPDMFDSTAMNYAQAVLTEGGRHLFLAGQVAFDDAMQIVGEGDMQAQAAKALDNIGRVLAHAGGGPENIVRVRYFVPDYDEAMIPPLLAAIGDFFGDGPLPAGTLIGVDALAFPGLMIEIEADAVLP